LTKPTKRQFGLWDSQITPVSMSRSISLVEAGYDSDGVLLWLENRSDRGVLMVQPVDGQAPRVLNDEISVRARVGYGGGDFTAGHGFVYFVAADSGRLYRQPTGSGGAEAITPAYGHTAAPVLSTGGDWLMYVHSYEGRDCLAIVDSAGKKWPQVLLSGDDFYMQPAWHPSGTLAAIVSWNHPNMPWDGTLLKLLKLRQTGKSLPVVDELSVIEGGADVSVMQPVFSPDGSYLAFVSDQTGWWQIYLHEIGAGTTTQITETTAEHGLPAWVQGMRTIGFSNDSRRLYFIRNQMATDSLWQYEIEASRESRLALDEIYTGLSQLTMMPLGEKSGQEQLTLLASGARVPTRLISVSIEGNEHVWRRSTAEQVTADVYSKPEGIDWLGMDGETAHGLYFAPQNPLFEGVENPPLIVNIHGGPTSQVRNNFNPRAQFFTSRGYAVLEVNYRGSTGYGREYRNKLRCMWGVYDVQDAVSGAKHLVDLGWVDPERLVIMGGSAGGFTVLKALEDYPGFFKAGVCLYGVSNQFTLVAETHKFETFYSDQLLGPLPEAASIYRERSPIYFVDKIQDPVAIFQGEDDKVVPRNQSDEVVASLRRRGIPHVYHLYAGEGHGFRKTETIEHFYRKVQEFLKQYVLYA
jgi:dipeptidyl aminopeptidase/acylaminoacyl peptidase